MPDAPFPHDFADLLTPAGREVLSWGADHPGSLRVADAHGGVLRDVIDPDRAEACVDALETHMRPHLVRRVYRLPPESRHEAGTLPFCGRRWDTDLSPGSACDSTAFELGLIRMLYSDSFLHFAEATSGCELATGRVFTSLFCYERGDYLGPHTDNGQSDPVEDWVILTVSLGSGPPATQLLMWEGPDGLTEAADVATGASIHVLRQPSWHQVSPLIAEPGADEPRRWMMAQVFRVLGPRED